jgi:hypothetical protein
MQNKKLYIFRPPGSQECVSPHNGILWKTTVRELVFEAKWCIKNQKQADQVFVIAELSCCRAGGRKNPFSLHKHFTMCN